MHFSIYDDGIFFGEAFYGIDCAHEDLASLDIKLFKHARGKGIVEKGLRFVIEQAFKRGAKKCSYKIEQLSKYQSLAALFCKELYLTSPLIAILENQFPKIVQFRRFENRETAHK